MSPNPQHRADDAERLLNDPILKKALADMTAREMAALLAGPPTGEADPDRWRRERIDKINTVQGIPHALRVAYLEAAQALKPKAGVA